MRLEDLTPEQREALLKWFQETFSDLSEMVARALEGLVRALGPELAKLLVEATAKEEG